MMASISLPVGESSACSVMETTLTPFLRNMDLKGDRVLALPGEAAELPDENDLKGSLRLAALLDHLPELGPVGHAAALGLVHELAATE